MFLDLPKFLQMAKEEDLLVIFRPGDAINFSRWKSFSILISSRSVYLCWMGFRWPSKVTCLSFSTFIIKFCNVNFLVWLLVGFFTPSQCTYEPILKDLPKKLTNILRCCWIKSWICSSTLKMGPLEDQLSWFRYSSFERFRRMFVSSRGMRT